MVTLLGGLMIKQEHQIGQTWYTIQMMQHLSLTGFQLEVGSK